MRILILIIISFFLCTHCGVKDDPKYQTKNKYNKKIEII